MMTPKEKNITPQNAEYRQADKIISQSIANMDKETHIEYGSTMERKSDTPKWKKWLQRLRRQYYNNNDS